jgi:peptidylprolyl isomerase
MKATNGHTVSVHYKGTLIDGTEFDNSRTRGQTLDFELGTGAMIEGFNNAVVGMTIGETKSITLEPDEAYGPINPEAFKPAPKEAFGPDFEFVIGELVQGNSPEGQFLAKIHEVSEDTVTLNLNHPLAGEQLTFEISLMEIHGTDEQSDVTMADWSASMKKAELLNVAKAQGLPVNTKSTKAQIIEALQTL